MSNSCVRTSVALKENLLAAYKDLRSRILGHTGGSWIGGGLAVIVRQGMAAWMEALSQPAAFATARVREQSRSDVAVPLDLRAEATRILAAMAVGSLQEVRR
jgi:hypothetical protein